MGAQARQNGLVDELGGLDEAVALVRKRARLSASGDTNLVMYPPRRSLLDVLMNSSETSLETVASAKLRQLFPGLPSQSFLKGGMMRIMPYQLAIH